LNPVAVLITKGLIEIPPKFAGRPPVNPEARRKLDHSGGWKGARGLAEDVRYYGKWMRDEAERRIGHLYPKAKLPDGKEATVIAWLWARTVKCPNPACGAQMPLVRSFALSTKKGKEAWVEPVIDAAAKTVKFEVKTGKGSVPEGTVNRRGARCLVCGTNAPLDHVRAEGRAGRMGTQLMAIVAEGERGRVYLEPNEEHERIAAQAEPHGVPETDLPKQALGFRVQGYGMTKHRDLFTPRQLVTVTTFSDIVSEARDKVLNDARAVGMTDDGMRLDKGGKGATAYSDAVTTYLAFLVDQLANHQSSICRSGLINST
jgi:putative DNA methylase